jgi:DNA-directed RNA polymerase subunit RPC12/RpoP
MWTSVAFRAVFIGAAVVLYVIMSVRVARQMRRLGRSPVRWFVITLLFTAIPASFVFLWYNFGWLVRRPEAPPRGEAPPREGRMVRCPRCARRVATAELDTTQGATTCPRCGSLFEEGLLG